MRHPSCHAMPHLRARLPPLHSCLRRLAHPSAPTNLSVQPTQTSPCSPHVAHSRSCRSCCSWCFRLHLASTVSDITFATAIASTLSHTTFAPPPPTTTVTAAFTNSTVASTHCCRRRHSRPHRRCLRPRRRSRRHPRLRHRHRLYRRHHLRHYHHHRRHHRHCLLHPPNSEYDGRGVPRVGTSVPRVAKLRVPCPQGTIGVPKLYTWYILSIMIRSMYFFSGRFCCTQHEGRIKLVSTARSGRHQEAGEAIYSG